MDFNSDADRTVVDDHKKVALAEMEGGSSEDGSGDKSTLDQNSVSTVNCKSLTELLDNLRIRNDMDEEAADSVDVAELAQSRMEALNRQQMARKGAWIAESRKEVLERKEFQQTNLLGVLDLLAWDGIMENLWPEEKVKMSTMAWEWRNRLERERVLFLFGKVFPILCKHSFKDITDHDAAKSFAMNCRLVCNLWMESIGECLSIPNVTGTPDGIPHISVDFARVESLISFNYWSEHTFRGRNPFPSRTFKGSPVAINRGLLFDIQYWIELEKMLRRWGGELWTLYFRCNREDMEGTYLFLCKALSFTPNLRMLCLMDPFGLVEGDMRRPPMQDSYYDPLKLVIEKNPLPELPHLRSLVFANFAPGPLVQAVLAKYGDSLELLEFHRAGHDGFTGEYMDPGEFMSGRVLPLHKYTCLYGPIYREDSRTSQFSHWNYQFTSLDELDLSYIDIPGEDKVGNIFKTVNSCGSTLRRLRLMLNFRPHPPTGTGNWHDRWPQGLSLELLQLEMLDLYVTSSNITNVDFLLPLVSLKTLTFSYDAAESADSLSNGKDVIQFVGYRDRLYKSNIWKLLPDLRLVRLKTVPIKQGWMMDSLDHRGMRFPFNGNGKVTVYNRDGWISEPFGSIRF